MVISHMILALIAIQSYSYHYYLEMRSKALNSIILLSLTQHNFIHLMYAKSGQLSLRNLFVKQTY